MSTLSVSTSANVSTKLTVNGLGLSGGDGSSTPYPLVVQGSNQGVWINIDGSRSTANNFVTFSDANGQCPGNHRTANTDCYTNAKPDPAWQNNDGSGI